MVPDTCTQLKYNYDSTHFVIISIFVYFYQDRLEQSHATNRSMQNYVQFLKSSYASVMGDISTTSPISPVRASSSLREGGASLRQPHF